MKTEGGGVKTGIAVNPFFINCLVGKIPFPTLKGTQPREEHKRLHDVKKITRVHSFSRPEKLPLKTHKGSSRTFYSCWVKKPYFFQIGQVFVVTCRVRMFLILADFLSTL
jgi:hypothetical protein